VRLQRQRLRPAPQRDDKTRVAGGAGRAVPNRHFPMLPVEGCDKRAHRGLFPSRVRTSLNLKGGPIELQLLASTAAHRMHVVRVLCCVALPNLRSRPRPRPCLLRLRRNAALRRAVTSTFGVTTPRG
jgi:hypothetical protein